MLFTLVILWHAYGFIWDTATHAKEWKMEMIVSKVGFTQKILSVLTYTQFIFSHFIGFLKSLQL